nr:DEAD/DEAH box helicase [Kofleriaceae bacterium]
MAELLARFVAAFERGIEGELEAMRASTDAFEISLADGEELGGSRYRFGVPGGDRVVAGTVCALTTGQRVTIEAVGDGRVTLAATLPIDLAAPCALVIAPWFLYDRLVQALRELADAPLALALFKAGGAATASPSALLRDHAALNASQRAAVQLCADREVAFVWGPPGTGKTVTLVHVIDELLARGERILLASTTNAAIDQVLAKLAAQPWFAPGAFVRVGRSDAETFGCEVADLVDARRGARRDALSRLRRRIGEAEVQLRYARGLVAELVPAVGAQQSLFAAAAPRASASALTPLFAGAADAMARLDARAQMRAIELRATRLERIRALAKAKLAARTAEDRDVEARVLADARVVLCTLTNTYLAPALQAERFDTLIAEEAGMATLPALFVAASRCTRRAIMVGDPRQLPPIVQSDDPVVRRAIGRNVFDVAVPEPTTSAAVALLDVQYRMHPAIGSLVGELFYGGRLVHGAAGTDAIAARAPFPGRAVVVVDTPSTCQRSQKGSSRVNPASAAVVAELAAEAARSERTSDGPASIAVITPYAAQAADIRRLLAARRLADIVECSTIHRFQGRECDVVIIDLVDAAPMRPSALVGDAPNLLNVSISRARGKLVIVADVSYFETAAPDGLVASLLRAAAGRSR